jgi:hypothetical protein
MASLRGPACGATLLNEWSVEAAACCVTSRGVLCDKLRRDKLHVTVHNALKLLYASEQTADPIGTNGDVLARATTGNEPDQARILPAAVQGRL